jgi:hypothetical protein
LFCPLVRKSVNDVFASRELLCLLTRYYLAYTQDLSGCEVLVKDKPLGALRILR